MLTAAQFVGFTTLLQVWTGSEFIILVWFAALSTIIYTAFAGIKSDFFTDVIHFFVMFIVLFLILLPITITNIGGLGELSNLPSSYFDPFKYGGISFFIAGIFFGAGSVFVTMELWQRIYASTTAKKAKYALLWSIIIIVFFYVISTFFGMSLKLLLPDLLNRDQALFVLMKNYLPVGLLGLGIAGFMAIFISTINSTIMVASATITKDFFVNNRKIRPEENKILRYGRISTLFCGIVGLIIAIIYPNLVALSVNSLFMLLILVPSVMGGFFWRQATEKGAFYSIISGLIVMALFFFIDPTTAFVPAFVVSLLTFIIVSLSTKHDESEDLNIVKGWKNNN
jgi:Na+/proline symporter